MRKSMLAIALLVTVALFSGCDPENSVYQKSVAVLNDKAQGYMKAGNYTAAVGRLESALDLIPNQPDTLRNIAIAYQAAAQYDKSVEAYQQLIKTDTDTTRQSGYYKSMGIAHEAWGDQAKLAWTESADDPKKQADRPALKEKAILQYQLAIDSYQKALTDPSQGKALAQQSQMLQDEITKLQGQNQ